MKTLLLLASMLLIAGVVAAADEEQPKQSASAAQTANSRRQAIRAEIKTLGSHAWAGEYYSGDGMGENVSVVIAPRSGYVFEWHGCLGLYDRNFGTAEWVDGRIRLSFTFENERKGFQGIAPEFLPVAWGSRHYLIPADDVVGFCNAVNDGEEPRNGGHGSYLLRLGDEKRSVSGLPRLPAADAEYLLAKPIEAAIVAVGVPTTRPSIVDWKFKDTPVTIDAGKQRGLREGMVLSITKPKNTVESVRVTRVEENQAEAVMVQMGETEPGPQVGWRLSTRSPWKAR